MARTAPKTNAQQASEQTAHLGGASGAPPSEQVSTLPPLVVPEPMGTAVQAPDPDAEPAKPIRRFTVLATRNIMHRGAMVLLRAGKEIDELNYEVEHLRRQGVALKEIEPPTVEG